MLRLRIINIDGQTQKIYGYSDFPYEEIRGVGTVDNRKAAYADIICSFDIETTTMLKEESNMFGKDYGFMYVWQMAVGDLVCMGRTWSEWLDFLARLQEEMHLYYRRLVIWVHNLAFEFQFFRNFLPIDDLFARDKRKVIYCVSGCFEFRCSMMLTNMSLAKYTQKTPGVVHVKQDGEEFDYRIKRYPDTELTDKEMWYCVCDVLGLNEALSVTLQDDTLITVPLTSTGFVRRDYKEVCLKSKEHMKQFKRSRLQPIVYQLCKEGSRGAIAGSSHLWTDETLEDVDSFDIKSSYPFQMATKYFPQGPFRHGASCKTDNELFRHFINEYCCIMTITMDNIRLKRYSGIPYISKAKCRAIQRPKTGNGKVYSAEKIGMVCTEIDFRIIEEDYEFENLEVWDLWYAKRGMLSVAFRSHLLEMFQIKTDLEGGDKFMYDKYKNKINASFGMMLTDIVHEEILYKPFAEKVWQAEKPEDLQQALDDYYRGFSSFLSYQHGVWVLAHGRDSLHEGMRVVGRDLVQVDTDSVKTLGDYKEEFDQLNRAIIERAESYDVKPYSIKGDKKVYLGVWEHEGGDGYTYDKFRSLGAKKYAYDNGDGVKITVAGLKKTAGKWLTEHGGLEAFTNGTVVPPGVSGRTASTYVDLYQPVLCIINGHEVWLGSNIGIRESNYTFGMTSEWLELIADGKIPEDAQLPGSGAYTNLIADI